MMNIRLMVLCFACSFCLESVSMPWWWSGWSTEKAQGIQPSGGMNDDYEMVPPSASPSSGEQRSTALVGDDSADDMPGLIPDESERGDQSDGVQGGGVPPAFAIQSDDKIVVAGFAGIHLMLRTGLHAAQVSVQDEKKAQARKRLRALIVQKQKERAGYYGNPPAVQQSERTVQQVNYTAPARPIRGHHKNSSSEQRRR